MNEKVQIKFAYNKQKDLTSIQTWFGRRLTDIKEMSGTLSSYQKKKIRKELIQEEEEY